jgi:hypothetical protein
VSEISGIQGPQTRAQSRSPRDAHSPAPQARARLGAPGSRLCAPALSRACSGRDDKRRHVEPAAHTGRRGNTLGVTRTFAPRCHPGISRERNIRDPGAADARPAQGAATTRTARRPRHAPSPGPLDPGSAQPRCRALASAGMTKRARHLVIGLSRAALTVIPDVRPTLSSGNLAQLHFVIPEFRAAKYPGSRGQRRAPSPGVLATRTARRPRHAPSTGPLDPGSARRRLRALAPAGMTKGGTSNPPLTPDDEGTRLVSRGLSPHVVIPEFRVSEISGIQGPQTRAQPKGPQPRAQPGAPGTRPARGPWIPALRDGACAPSLRPG